MITLFTTHWYLLGLLIAHHCIATNNLYIPFQYHVPSDLTFSVPPDTAQIFHITQHSIEASSTISGKILSTAFEFCSLARGISSLDTYWHTCLMLTSTTFIQMRVICCLSRTSQRTTAFMHLCVTNDNKVTQQLLHTMHLTTIPIWRIYIDAQGHLAVQLEASLPRPKL